MQFITKAHMEDLGDFDVTDSFFMWERNLFESMREIFWFRFELRLWAGMLRRIGRPAKWSSRFKNVIYVSRNEGLSVKQDQISWWPTMFVSLAPKLHRKCRQSIKAIQTWAVVSFWSWAPLLGPSSAAGWHPSWCIRWRGRLREHHGSSPRSPHQRQPNGRRPIAGIWKAALGAPRRAVSPRCILPAWAFRCAEGAEEYNKASMEAIGEIFQGSTWVIFWGILTFHYIWKHICTLYVLLTVVK